MPPRPLPPSSPAGPASQQQQPAAAQQQQQPAAEQPCPVVSPPDPAAATRREISKLSDLLLWGLAVALVCVCCPVGLLFSVALSLGGAALALLLTFPEMLLQLASTAGLEVWSMLAGLDVTSVALGIGLTVVKAAKTLWFLGLDVWSLVVSIAVGVAKLVAAVALGEANSAWWPAYAWCQQPRGPRKRVSAPLSKRVGGQSVPGAKACHPVGVNALQAWWTPPSTPAPTLLTQAC